MECRLGRKDRGGLKAGWRNWQTHTAETVGQQKRKRYPCRFDSCPGHNAFKWKGATLLKRDATNQIGAICTAD